MKTSLISGAAGFLGSNLAEALLKKGHRVIGIDNLSTGSKDNIKHLFKNKNFTFIELDVNTDRLKLKYEVYAVYKPTYVFHYAAMVGVKRTLENPLNVLKDINGTKNILKLSKQYKTKKVIYASSSEVYGEPIKTPEKENGIINAKLPYAQVKLIGETLMKEYNKQGLPTTTFRFFNIYGPRQTGSDYGFVTSIFIKQVLSGKRPRVFGNGKQTRDMVFVNDNVEATLRCLNRPKTNGQVINIGSGKPTTIQELALIITKASGKKNLKPKNIPFPKGRIDVKHRLADTTKMKKLLNYTPKTSLKQGIQKTIQKHKK